MKRTRYAIASLAICAGLMFSCGDSSEGDAGHDNDGNSEMHEGHDGNDADMGHEGHEMEGGDADGSEKTGGERPGMDEMPTIGGIEIQPGSVEASMNDWITGHDTGEIVFVLDKIPFDDEGESELSADGKAQLDVLSSLLKNNPDLMCEVQGHTTKAKNAIGAKTKKAATGARALWVKTKLSLRGVEGKQLSATGYGDEQLLPDLEPEDAGQKRIAIKLNK